MPSPQVLTALARALRLTETERDHLFRLAGQPVPDESRIHDTLPGSVRRLVEQLSASPAAVYDVRWNPIAWNAMWVAVMGDPLEYEEAIVADLRSSSARYPGDRRLTQLIADLRDVSPRFCRLWEARRVGVYDQERKIIDHPELGLLHLDCDILTTHRNDLRVVVYTAAPGTESAHQLDMLRAASSLQPNMAS